MQLGMRVVPVSLLYRPISSERALCGISICVVDPYSVAHPHSVAYPYSVAYPLWTKVRDGTAARMYH
jgi:hypothetical protein